MSSFTKFKQNNSQSGVTLLLAILVLSAIMAISFSLATILFVEVRSSSDLVKSEPALYGANGVAEEAIFNVKRNVCSTNCNYTALFGNNVSLPTNPVHSILTTPIFQDKIPPGTNFYSAKRYALYNTSSSNPATSGSGYGKITISYLDTGNAYPLYVYLCQFDPNKAVDATGNTAGTYNTTACSDPINTVTGNGSSYWSILNSNNFQMIPGTATETYTWYLDPALQQELILFNPTTSNGNNIFVKIEAFGPGSTYAPIGLPYSGSTAVDINAKYGQVNRKIRIVVPNTSGGVATPINVSKGKTAIQVSTSFGGDASRAIDDNTSGLWSDNSVTHTSGGSTDWWEVDLGASYNISSVMVWNRMDCCKSRLTDYYVYISNTSGGTNHSYHQTSYPDPSSTISTPGASGRYVRVQLSGSATNFNSGGYYLHMGEVQVFGTPIVVGGNSSSVDLDGSNDYTSIPHNSAYNLSQFTVEAWVYPQEVKGDHQPIIVKQNSTGSGRAFGLFVNPGGMSVHYSFMDGACSSWRSYDSVGQMTINSWNHVAMTYNGTAFNLYINGVLDSSRSITSSVCNNSNAIRIGSEASAYTPFNGLVDEVRIWNAARTAGEINTNKSLLLNGNESGLVGYWKFDEGSGTTGADATSVGNPATLNNGATWSTNKPF